MIPLTERQLQVLAWLRACSRTVEEASPGDRVVIEQLIRHGLAAEARSKQKRVDAPEGELLGWYALPKPDWNP